MNIAFSSRSRHDLIAIGEWIARDDRGTAARFVDEVTTACETIGEHPMLYPFVSANGALRRKLFAPYLIFYRVRRGEVLIVSVRQGARDNSGMR